MADHLLPDYAATLADPSLIDQLSSIRLRDAIPHALLFCGDEGGEALPLALAFARHILCEQPGADACGQCESSGPNRRCSLMSVAKSSRRSSEMTSRESPLITG